MITRAAKLKRPQGAQGGPKAKVAKVKVKVEGALKPEPEPEVVELAKPKPITVDLVTPPQSPSCSVTRCHCPATEPRCANPPIVHRRPRSNATWDADFTAFNDAIARAAEELPTPLTNVYGTLERNKRQIQ